jgi:hypothetical protein
MTRSPRIVINIRNPSGGRDSAEARRTIARWLLSLTLLMIYFCGVFPFDFSSGFAGAIDVIRQRFDFTTAQLGTRESWEKFVFYMPLGFALGSLLWAWRGQRAQQIVLRCAIAFSSAAAIAASVELLQAFLSREPSLADIISKTAGSAAGFAVFILLGDPVVRLLVRSLTAIKKINDPRVFAAAAVVWLLIAMAAPLTARNLGSLRSWDPSDTLLIGNETDGIRHWDGMVSNVWLSAAALGEEEMDSALTATDPTAKFGDSLMMAFHFDGTGPYTDSTGHTAPLAWTPNFNKGAAPGTTQPSDLTGVDAIGRVGVPVGEAWWLSTAPGGAAAATNRIMQTQAFTLVMDLAMRDFSRGDGWPRIFTISKDGTDLNLQLLQDHENLQLRIRNGCSGNTGVDPELVIPDIFSDTNSLRLIVTYDHGLVRVATNKSGEPFSLQYLPDSWLVWRIFPSGFWLYRMNSDGQQVASCMYRILAMLPIGLLLGNILRILRKRGRTDQSHIIFISSTCAAACLLEAVLYFAAGVPLSISSPIASLAAVWAGTWLILGNLPVRRQWV